MAKKKYKNFGKNIQNIVQDQGGGPDVRCIVRDQGVVGRDQGVVGRDQGVVGRDQGVVRLS